MATIAIPEGIAPEVEAFLRQSSEMHSHAWPLQVLGIRMGILAGKLLDIPVPQTEKRLLAIIETGGCAADGVSVATNCWVGRRTLRIEDYGKIAANFVDTDTSRALRIAPRAESRHLALRTGSGSLTLCRHCAGRSYCRPQPSDSRLVRDPLRPSAA